jgi:uncharacterized membrane protein YphA (DoxX/SURF4 family)
MCKISAVTKTADRKIMLIPRLLAGLPMLGFGVMHFVKPEHFREILIASGIPMVELSAIAAPLALILGGLLLLLGLFARIGGLLGIATMVVAIYSTVVLSGMTVDNLPAGLTEVPFVPPLPVPVIVTIASLVVVVMGGGGWSLDWRCQSCQASQSCSCE